MIHLEEFEIFQDRTFLGMTDKNFNLNYWVKVYQSMQHIKYQLYNKYYQLYTTYKTIYCSAWPRLKLNTKIGLHTTHHHPPPTTTTTQTLRQQYLSCYWPDLDQTLNKGSWEHIQQITTVTTTFVQATFVLGTFVLISNISAVTGPILDRKVVRPKIIFEPIILLDQNIFWTQYALGTRWLPLETKDKAIPSWTL